MFHNQSKSYIYVHVCAHSHKVRFTAQVRLTFGRAAAGFTDVVVVAVVVTEVVKVVVVATILSSVVVGVTVPDVIPRLLVSPAVRALEIPGTVGVKLLDDVVCGGGS